MMRFRDYLLLLASAASLTTSALGETARQSAALVDCQANPPPPESLSAQGPERVDIFYNIDWQRDQAQTLQADLIRAGLHKEKLPSPYGPVVNRPGLPDNGVLEVKYFEDSNRDNACTILMLLLNEDFSYQLDMNLLESSPPGSKVIEVWWPAG